MTIAEMILEGRGLIDEIGEEWIDDTTSPPFTFTRALQRGYSRYAMETKCFRVGRALDTVVGQAVYSFAAFGSEAADTDSLSVLAPADNTNDFTLVAGQPSNTYVDGHYISVTIKNPTGGALAELAKTYTIVGTLPGGAAYSEVLTATAQSLAAGASHTLTSTTRRFATVSRIYPSQAQSAGLEHSAGVGAQTAGARLFDLTCVTYDKANAEPTYFPTALGEGRLVNDWRVAANATPEGYLRWGDRAIRFVPPPNAVKIVEAEGYETPDMTSFAVAADEPDVIEDDCELIVVWACILAIVRDPSDANAIRQSILYPRWESGIAAAKARIHAQGSFVIGRNAGLSARSIYQGTDDITMAP